MTDRNYSYFGIRIQIIIAVRSVDYDSVRRDPVSLPVTVDTSVPSYNPSLSVKIVKNPLDSSIIGKHTKLGVLH